MYLSDLSVLSTRKRHVQLENAHFWVRQENGLSRKQSLPACRSIGVAFLAVLASPTCWKQINVCYVVASHKVSIVLIHLLLEVLCGNFDANSPPPCTNTLLQERLLCGTTYIVRRKPSIT